ncbi:MAG: uracil-DNA glycosylase [Candidatus Methanomethylophilaceae archaeon]|nr:uracil-DNA glycosylase [Candidatus Methanomethylophilaceae archaeon]MBO5668761.1 uracil-DNA glycosylase [Candidatus Methanomethylophilaceae archaeon]
MSLGPGSDCRLCGLCEGRTTIVLPDGNLLSKVVFVGEAPGENEDVQGRPFVGKSGKILEGAMEAAGISRSDVMITNTVKCRPPNNRDPKPEEMEACRPFLESELSDRSLVVGLGKSAIRDLIGYDGKMADIVNKVIRIEIGGSEVEFLPTYHPAACIYNKGARAALADAMAIVRSYL